MYKHADLLLYLPLYLHEFKEFQEIAKSENIEIDSLHKIIKKVLDNTFLLTCDESFLNRLEELLNIKPSSGDTLEIRRSRLLSIFRDNMPYTFHSLFQKLREIQGNEQFEVVLDGSNYTLHIRVRMENGQIESLNEIIKSLPCNLVFDSQNSILGNDNINIYHGITIAYTEKYVIK